MSEKKKCLLFSPLILGMICFLQMAKIYLFIFFRYHYFLMIIKIINKIKILKIIKIINDFLIIIT